MRKFKVALALLIVSSIIISHSITLGFFTIIASQQDEKGLFSPGTMSAMKAQHPIIRDLDNVELERMMMEGEKGKEVGDFQPSACQLVPIVHLLHYPGCQPKAIASYACSGSCPSYVRVSKCISKISNVTNP